MIQYNYYGFIPSPYFLHTFKILLEQLFMYGIYYENNNILERRFLIPVLQLKKLDLFFKITHIINFEKKKAKCIR